MTTPLACLLSCDLSMHQPVWLLTMLSWDLSTRLTAELWPVHQHGCSVVICPQASLSRCYLPTSLAAQLLHIQQLAHQLGCTVVTHPTTCPLSCHLSTSLPGSVVTYPPAWLLSCDLSTSLLCSCDMSTSLLAQLCHVHHSGCSVVTWEPACLCSCDMSIRLTAQLWLFTVQHLLSAWLCTTSDHTVIIGGLLHASNLSP